MPHPIRLPKLLYGTNFKLDLNPSNRPLAQANCTTVYIDLFLVSVEGYHIFIPGL